METRLKTMAAILAIGITGALATGCGESDSTSGNGVNSTPESTGDPAATVPTTGSEDDNGALGGAGPTGGQSAPESGAGATTQPDSSTGGTGGY